MSAFLKNIDLLRALAAGVFLSVDPPVQGFCFGWKINFVGLDREGGGGQSVRRLEGR